MEARGKGLLAAAAGAAIATVVARQAVDRTRKRVESEAAPALRSASRTVTTPDGVPLHVEVEAADTAPVGAATLVFVHGFTMSQDCWHYQRAHFRGRRNMVLLDHRSHGRSGVSPTEGLTIAQLGCDLRQVLDEVVPDQPVVLVGHSMGGMTIMSLAEHFPELFGDRVVGVALIGTAAGGMATVSVLAPIIPDRLSEAIKPPLTKALRRIAPLMDRSRQRMPNAMFLGARAVGLGSQASAEKVGLVARDLSVTPSLVVLDMSATFDDHDRYHTLARLGRVPALVISGSRDLITPAKHSRDMHEGIPGSRLLSLQGAAHCVMIERDVEVNEALEELLAEADGCR